MTSSSPSVRRPVSASSFAVGICGLVAFFVALIAVHHIVTNVKPECEIAYLGLMVMIVTALGVFLPDILWNKVHTRLQGEGSRSFYIHLLLDATLNFSGGKLGKLSNKFLTSDNPQK